MLSENYNSMIYPFGNIKGKKINIMKFADGSSTSDIVSTGKNTEV